ncbi:hypothetical protein IFM89_032362 [Coptis chinensis]|uniref:Replication factor A C-terminal domain-containing protein n=1 Tax=Coptis chinensis TaxID=261450 RepID=A0A835HW11_9MAGN|nr:hypothetical protein IFM89_032362 [Coptis chinensis]
MRKATEDNDYQSQMSGEDSDSESINGQFNESSIIDQVDDSHPNVIGFLKGISPQGSRKYIEITIVNERSGIQSIQVQIEEPHCKEINAMDILQNENKTTEQLKILAKIYTNRGTFHTCKATIKSVNGKVWHYSTCPQCPRKQVETDSGSYCEFCELAYKNPKERYKLEIDVEDETGETTFDAFGKHADFLIEQPIEKLLDISSQASKGIVFSKLTSYKLIYLH